MITHIHNWNTASDKEREKIGEMIAKYNSMVFNKNNFRMRDNFLHCYTVYITSLTDPYTLVAYGTGTVYKTGDYPTNIYRSGQWNFRANCMRGLWIDSLYSNAPGCGTIILAELEKLLQTHIELVPRKNIYCNSVDSAAGFYRSKGYITIKTSALNPKNDELDWKNIEVDCPYEWSSKGYCWLAKPCIGNDINGEELYQYNFENPEELIQAFIKQELTLLEKVIVFPKSFCQTEHDTLVARLLNNLPYSTSPKFKLGRPTAEFLWKYLISHVKLTESGVFVSFDKSVLTESLLNKITNIEDYVYELLSHDCD